MRQKAIFQNVILLPVIIFLFTFACTKQKDKYEYIKVSFEPWEGEFVTYPTFDCDEVLNYEEDIYLGQGNKIKIDISENSSHDNSLWIVKPDMTHVSLTSYNLENYEKETDHLLMTIEEITEKEVIYLDVDNLYGSAEVDKINGKDVKNFEAKVKVFDLPGLYYIEMGNEDDVPGLGYSKIYCLVE